MGPGSEAAAPLDLDQIEEQYWRLVTSGTEHVCVHSAAIDTGTEGHGFTIKDDQYGTHAWNPKVPYYLTGNNLVDLLIALPFLTKLLVN